MARTIKRALIPFVADGKSGRRDDSFGEDSSRRARRARAQEARQRGQVPDPRQPKSSGLVRRQVVVGKKAKRTREEPPGPHPKPAPARPEIRERALEEESGPPQVSEEWDEVLSDDVPLTPVTPASSGATSAPRGGRAQKSERRRHRKKLQGLQGEEAWSGVQSMSLWWVLAGILCVAVVAYFLAMNFNDREQVRKIKTPQRTLVKKDFEPSEVSEFVAAAEDLLPGMAEVLEAFKAAEGEDLVPLMPEGAESLARFQEWRARQAVPARYDVASARELHAAALGKKAYLVLTGLDKEHLAAAAYFIRRDGKFLYDWEASEGYSELLPGEAEELDDEEPRLMRAVVSVSGFYTPQFPEKEYRCYALHHRDPGVYIWAFAKRNTVLDTKMLATYYGRDVPGTSGRVTVRVRKGPEGARFNQFEIVEFVQNDWINLK